MIIFSESKNTDLMLCRTCTVIMVSIERTEPTGQTGQTEQVSVFECTVFILVHIFY